MSPPRTLEARGRTLALLRGRGPARPELPPLILVHGAGGAARNFFSTLRGLPEQAVAIDLPGHGRSEGPAPESITEAAELLIAAGAALFGPDTRFAIAGHSLGGAEALHATSTSAGEIIACGLINTGAHLRLGTELAELAAHDFEVFLATMAERGTRDVTIDQLRATGSETVSRDLGAAAGHNLLPDAARCRVPTVILTGTHDEVATPESCLELCRAIEGSTLLIFEGAGHLLPVERAPDLTTALLGWLNQTERLSGNRWSRDPASPASQ